MANTSDEEAVLLWDRTRDLTGAELKLVAGGLGISLGDGFRLNGLFHEVMRGALVGGAADGLSGAIHGAELGAIKYMIHHPLLLK